MVLILIWRLRTYLLANWRMSFVTLTNHTCVPTNDVGHRSLTLTVSARLLFSRWPTTTRPKIVGYFPKLVGIIINIHGIIEPIFIICGQFFIFDILRHSIHNFMLAKTSVRSKWRIVDKCARFVFVYSNGSFYM